MLHVGSGRTEGGGTWTSCCITGVTVLGQWISIAELAGQVFALAVVFLAERRTLWTWPVQVGATVLLFSVYISAHLGGLASRQIAILAISFTAGGAGIGARSGVRRRRRARGGDRAGRDAGRVRRRHRVMALVLQALNASWAPWPDAAIFVGTLVAFGAQGAGLVEFWLVWLVVDAIGVPLQISSGLYFSAAIYIVFAGLVVHGWWSWNRTAKNVQRAPVTAASS